MTPVATATAIDDRPSSQAAAPERKEGQFIKPLTSSRFGAAMMVLLYHTLPESAASHSTIFAFRQAADYGHTAVAFFFVLSGFILATVYPAIRDASELRRFLVARSARIYPLYIFSMVADVPRLALHRIAKYGSALGLSAIAGNFLLQASLISAVIPAVSPLDGPSWSIPVEFCFYLSFPWIIGWAARLTNQSRSSAWWVGLFSVLFSLVFVPPAIVSAISYRGSELLELILGRNPVFQIPQFIIGVFLARMAKDPSPRFRRAAVAVLLLGFAGCGAVVAFSNIQFHPLRSALMVPFFAMIILGLAVSRGWITKMLSLPILVFLGEASYALYLIHLPLWEAFRPLGADRLLPVYIAYIATAILASAALHLGIERPCRTWLRRRFSPAPIA